MEFTLRLHTLVAKYLFLQYLQQPSAKSYTGMFLLNYKLDTVYSSANMGTEADYQH